MKNIPAIQTALATATALQAIPEVVIDWNMNRYVKATAANTPSDLDVGFDIELFPIESIVEPLRPTKGINKARVGTSTIADDYLSKSKTTPFSRYYIAGIDDPYKYWTSPYPSNSAGSVSNCRPQVVYESSVSVNKIVITTENSWASAKTFSIQTTNAAAPANDGDWNEIASHASINSSWKGSGQIVLYWNGTQWTSGGRVDNADKSPKTKSIRGVRLIVTSLEGGYEVTSDDAAVQSTYVLSDDGNYQSFYTDGNDSHFDLIEIGAHLEVDLSPYVISVDDDFELGDPSTLYPVGTITNNQGTLSLSNLYLNGGEWESGIFSADNTSSPYANYVDANAEVTIKYKYFDENGNALGTVPEAVMYTETWTGQSEETVTVQLSDFSKFLSETIVRPAMWEELTVPEITWRILDSVGFVNYRIDRDADRVTEHQIPIFYTNGEQTVWEVLDELSKASQTAIYFDARGVLQVKTRDFAMSKDDAPVWNFRSETTGQTLSNIVTLEQTNEFEPNHYKVIYQKTNWSPDNRGMPTMQKVWEPEGTLVLRGTPLVRTLAPGDDSLWVGSDDVKVWPYEGLVNVGGELIRYEGKEFVYYVGPNGDDRRVLIVKSMDEHNNRNNDTPGRLRGKNHYTGALAITERAVWNSEEKRHPVDAEGYSVREVNNGNSQSGVAGWSQLRQQSKARLNTPGRFDQYRDLLIATRGDDDDTPFYFYGTRFKFVPSAGQPFAGLVFNNSGAGENGYFIELTPSKYLNAAERKNRNELVVYSRVNGNDKRLGDEALAIGENIEYEIDVSITVNGGDHRVRVWVNGKSVFNKNISGGEVNVANGKFGLFARGKTVAEFEYLYAIKDPPSSEPEDDFSFMDKIKRGYYGDMWFREWVFGWRNNKRRVKKKTNDPRHRKNRQFFDDFGPFVHEVREFDVKFDPSPVLHSRLYMTNDWSACALEYQATPFGAKFVIANTYRANAVLNGEDTLSYAGTGQSINQILTVFGRALIVDESQEEVAKNDDQIRRRGKIESELSSPWIQSKRMAKDVGDWMEDQFSYGNDSVSMEVFGNPLIEIGDIVNVNFPRKHIDADYFVVGIKNVFDAGIKTTLSLRRRRT